MKVILLADKETTLLKSRAAVEASLSRAIKNKDSWKVIIENKTLARIDNQLKALVR
jgi:hypothetical protein